MRSVARTDLVIALRFGSIFEGGSCLPEGSRTVAARFATKTGVALRTHMCMRTVSQTLRDGNVILEYQDDI